MQTSPKPAAAARTHWRWVGDVCVLNLAAFVWWAWCLAPASHHVFSTSISYRTMAGLMSQHAWGGVMLTILALFIIGCYQSDYRVQIAALVVAATFWMLLAGAFYNANPVSPGAGMYGSLSAVTLVRAIRLARIA